MRTVTIRGEPHSVMQAVNRQVAHYALHVGQIVLLARHFAGHRWQSLSVPRNQSVEFNRQVAAGHAQPAINCIILKGYTKHERQLSSFHFIESLPRKNR